MSETLAAATRFELEVRKSRFLVHAAPVESPEAALAYLASIEDRAATHNCWAYRIGQQYRFSDDGEPAGTAGKPILAAIDGQGCDRVMAVVTRWFGGIKLGAGGLVRAYTDAVAQALLGAQKLPLRRFLPLRCAVPYALEGMVRRELQQAGAQLGGVTHGDEVELAFSVADDAAAALTARLNEAGQGALRWLE